jgi:UDP-N-acetylmuramoyl-tripeptide--D-alanyl-D-alanine ligase
MLELGPESAAMHAGLADDLAHAGVDQVFAVGPLMGALADALPANMLAGRADTATDIEDRLAAALAPGDVIMIKGSNASRMGPLADRIKARFAPATAAAQPTQEQEDA